MQLPKQLVRRSARLQALHTCSAKASSDPTPSPPPPKRARRSVRDKENDAPVPAAPKAIVGGAFGTYEASLWQQHARVVGIDEAGRGPLAGGVHMEHVLFTRSNITAASITAGPVVAAACSVPAGWSMQGVADSKTLTPAQREELYEAIVQDEHAIVTTYGCIGTGKIPWQNPSTFSPLHRSIVDAPTIDRLNILQATLHGMHNCVMQLPDHAHGFVLVCCIHPRVGCAHTMCFDVALL